MATAEQSGLESSALVIAGKWFLHDPVNEVNGDPRPDRCWMELAASAWSFEHDVARGGPPHAYDVALPGRGGEGESRRLSGAVAKRTVCSVRIPEQQFTHLSVRVVGGAFDSSPSLECTRM